MTQDIHLTLQNFEGSLFELHQQIRQEERNILDIEISKITSLGLSLMDSEAFFIQGPRFIFFVALFLVCKTRKLLPKEEICQSIEEECEDFVSQFLEISQFRHIVNDLLELEQKRLPHFSRKVTFVAEKENSGLEEIHLQDLALLFEKIMERVTPIEFAVDEEFDLASLTHFLLDSLQKNGQIPFEDIFSPHKSKTELIALFLSLLELIKLQKIGVFKLNDSLFIFQVIML